MTIFVCLFFLLIEVACENIRFSSLFAAWDVSREGLARNVAIGEKRGETDVFAGYNRRDAVFF